MQASAVKQFPDGIELNGWRLTSKKAPISNSSARDEYVCTDCVHCFRAPAQFFPFNASAVSLIVGALTSLIPTSLHCACRVEERLGIPLPCMYFGQNSLTVTHMASGFSLGMSRAINVADADRCTRVI